MAEWKLRPQEREGTYQFSGTLYCTRGIVDELTPEEIIWIYRDILKRVALNGGLDYLQVYEDDSGRIIYCIDQLTKESVDSKCYDREENYCTLLFSHEY